MPRVAAKPVPCHACGELIEPGKMQCPTCRAWNTVPEIDETVLLSEVVSLETKRIKGGFADLWTDSGNQNDESQRRKDGFGGGILIDSTTLIAGHPGAGKSTLLLALAATFYECTMRECLYIAAEESAEAIRGRADRLETPFKDKIRIVRAMGGAANLPETIKRYKPGSIILDSLQGLVGNEHAEAENTLRVLKQLAVLLKTPIAIINHVTKGESFAGTMELQHEVDGCVTLEPTGDGDLREWFWHKHRFGKAYVGTKLLMTEKGLMWPTEEEEEEYDSEE